MLRAIIACCLIIPIVIFPNQAATNFSVYRVSVSSSGAQANASSLYPIVSSDGRFVVFRSFATNLVPEGTSGLFLHDMKEHTTKRIVESATEFSSISADGSFIAFPSYASDLVPNDINGKYDIFVYNVKQGTIERVSVSSNGTEADGDSRYPSISADGRFIAFESVAKNLTEDTVVGQDIFVHDRITGQTVLVSKNYNGVPGDGTYPSISGDASTVAFDSTSPLVLGDNNYTNDIYVYYLNTGQIRRASVNNVGVEGNNSSEYSSISSDGRFVTFLSSASNLVDNDNNNKIDIFVRDLLKNKTSIISKSTNGNLGNDSSFQPIISGNGRFVAFYSYATNLVPNDNNNYCGSNHLQNCWDIFVHDIITGQTKRVSIAQDGSESNGHSYNPSISGDGSVIVYESGAFNLINYDDDTNATNDIYAYVQYGGNLYLPLVER